MRTPSFIAAVLLTLLAAPAAQAAAIGGCPLLPRTFPTNQRVDRLPVLAGSEALLSVEPQVLHELVDARRREDGDAVGGIIDWLAAGR